MDLMNFLVPRKSGTRFSKLSVNVGGWKWCGGPVRGGLNWCRRRSQGRNPERLFVFEFNFVDNLSFREQMHPYQRPWPSRE